MATAALAWALETPAGHPTANLVLIQMAAQTVNRFGNYIYCGYRPALAELADLEVAEVDLALHILSGRRLVAALDRDDGREAWVMFPREGLDLGTLRECWRKPTKVPYRTPVPETRLAVYRRDGFRCLACQWAPPVPEGYDGTNALRDDRRCLELDHITPRSAGGRTVVSNLQSLCTPCNSSKGARI